MKTNRLLQGGLLAALTLLAVEALAQTTGQPRQSAKATLAAIPLGEVFTYFMVMFGPNKLVAPFVMISRGMDNAACRTLALKGFAVACLAGVAAATLGQKTLVSWGVSLPALLIASGLVLLLVAVAAGIS